MEKSNVEDFEEEVDGEGLGPGELLRVRLVGHLGDCELYSWRRGEEAERSFINEDTFSKWCEDETMDRGDGGG